MRNSEFLWRQSKGFLEVLSGGNPSSITLVVLTEARNIYCIIASVEKLLSLTLGFQQRLVVLPHNHAGKNFIVIARLLAYFCSRSNCVGSWDMHGVLEYGLQRKGILSMHGAWSMEHGLQRRGILSVFGKQADCRVQHLIRFTIGPGQCCLHV